MALKVKIAWLFLVVFFVCLVELAYSNPPGCTSSRFCPRRNLMKAERVGQRCRPGCRIRRGIRFCRGNRECKCTENCGFSCVKTRNRCPSPALIENSEGVTLYKKNSSYCYNPVETTAGQIYQFSDVFIYKCRPGYRLKDGKARHYCTARRKWTTHRGSVCIRACQRRNRIRAQANGYTCQPSCHTDNDCQGGRKCVCDGPCGRSCVNLAVDCGVVEPVAQATINYTGEGFFKIAYYSCMENYYIASGNTLRRCTGGGTWNGRPISCQKVTCEDPAPAIRAMSGEISNWKPGPYNVGTYFEFSCRSYHKLYGSRNRTCMSNGRWSGRDVRCDARDTTGRCKHPGVPIGGSLIGTNFEVGSWVNFRCNDNLVMVGEASQQCLFFYEWSGDGAPQCKDPRFRDSQKSVFDKLVESTSQLENTIASQQQLRIGRFISANFAPGHYVYFIFDLSKSVSDDSLNNSLTFAVKLVQRLSKNATGVVEYGIIVFASKIEVIVSTIDIQPTPAEIIQKLINIGLNREILRDKIKSGTHTYLAVKELERQLGFLYARDDKAEKQRHVFFLTDGKHNEGRAPQSVVNASKSRTNAPTFYSITSCLECSNPATGGEAYTELLGLAGGNPDNFIFIENFYVISKLLDQITNATLDFSECGQAGDVGSVKNQAIIGRVLSGVNASTQSWPWQVAISSFSSTPFRAFSGSNFLGGGSLINNRWVLTATHLFLGIARVGKWQQKIMLTFGIHKLPVTRIEQFSPQVEVYTASEIYEHTQYELYNYDIALIKVGKRYVQLPSGRLEDSGMSGWVNYTTYIRPVCLPCSESSCMGNYLTQQGLLSGNENAQERCTIETNAILETGVQNKAILAVATGFGHSEERRLGDGSRATPSVFLQQGLLKLHDDTYCFNFTNSYIPWDGGRIQYSDQMICASSGIAGELVDTCQGDSGGPLVREVKYLDGEEDKSCWVQAGIVSWGWGCGQTTTVEGRRGVQIPGFYTNVMVLMEWVNSTMTQNSD